MSTHMAESLQSIRAQIDNIDERMVHLLCERARLAQKVGVIKGDGPKYHPAREAEVIRGVVSQNTGPLSDTVITTIFTEIIAACRAVQQPLTVAYLGPEGTYSEEAARSHCGTASVYVPQRTIDDTVRSIEASQADVGLIPIENSSEGAVNRTLDLLLETPLQIQAEMLLPIHHQLLSQASSLDDVAEVHAHPQALAQCQGWLSRYMPHARQIPSDSNAAAATYAAEQRHVGAIAGTRAAARYGLPILAGNIEDDPSNTTRFVVLGREHTKPTGNDKTSLVWSIANQAGALQKALAVLADNDINMVKLESRPAKHSLWEYIFYVDIEGHQDDPGVVRALKDLSAQLKLVKILGSYPKGASHAKR